ncbi:hypothetical protein NPS01_39250 [Nocardioides psychrotolerans]|uniref:Universal stress protein family protein n=1 Tax=Nocardioides psychrotolerans TaxID=1005945 RepID=A0A1I3R005_9ACTN|nr:universal stress protein [Nocardioides psychrotolerans]GEP40262.1 hypothetical protein NPS01_39250 [Nocardioides psychrotolerans]SFJ38727.1 Universal stress protein family protein [Nocardioides psychrotolerans]
MVDTSESRPVLVAVAGDGSESAVRYGVAEAARRRTTVHLVHVIDLVPWREPAVLGVAERRARKGEETLWDAVAYARSLAGERVVVTSELFHGEVISGLLEVGQEAALLVLRRRQPLVSAGQAQAVCLKVAARSRVPVVCVPHDWHGVEGATTVTVGVDHAATSGATLREALAASKRRGAGLRIMCGWWMARDNDHAGATHGIDPRSVRSDLERVVATIVADDDSLATVPVTIEVLHARPADLLVDASHGTDLLVVGRHDPLVPSGSRIGPVARAVVARASCPVLLPVPGEAPHLWHGPAQHHAPQLRTGARA